MLKIKIGQVYSEIIGQIGKFLPIFFHMGTKISKQISGVIEPNLT